jgi:hypothetical protein
MTTIFRHRKSLYSLDKYDDEDEEFSSNTNNINDSIFKDCKKSKLKIIFMHNQELKKKRQSIRHESENKDDDSDVEGGDEDDSSPDKEK